jgi:hypothetical protein
MKISTNSRSKFPASNIARPLRPSPVTLCRARSGKKLDGRLNGTVIVHGQDFCTAGFPRADAVL